MNPLMIAALVGLSVVAIGGGALILRAARHEHQRARERAAGLAPEHEDDDSKPQLVQTITKIGEAVSAGKTSKTLAEELVKAGYHSPSAAVVFVGSKILLFALGLMGFGLMALTMDGSLPMRIFTIAIGATVLFFVPNLVVRQRRAKRKEEVNNALPDGVDMLEICVSSGMGMDQAWGAVADEIRRVSVMFADEMELTTLEMSLGVPRANAMKNMADRTGAEELSSLVALLVQSEKFGASITEALTTFAQTMREQRSQKAEEAAEKMSVKLLFPMVMFIFPAMLIVMMGPAVLELVDVLGAS